MPHTYAIGDIHGCKDELVTLVRSLRNQGLEHEDTLVFVGDYVDRGPDSKGVIDALMHLSEYQKCVFLMGNHEDMMLWYLNIQHSGVSRVTMASMEYGAYWIPNGGGTTLKSYGIDDVLDFSRSCENPRERMVEIIGEKHLDFLKGLQYFHIEEDNLFVHAGVSWGASEHAETPEDAVEDSTDEHLLWDRDAYRRPNQFGTMIYGHTPSKKGVRWLRREAGPPYSVGTDVGCVFGANPLTAVRITDWHEFI